MTLAELQSYLVSSSVDLLTTVGFGVAAFLIAALRPLYEPSVEKTGWARTIWSIAVNLLLPNVVMAQLVGWFVAAETTTALGWLSPLHGQLAHLPSVAKILVFFIAYDFVYYWLHRAMHTKLLWPIHALHHSPTRITWLTGLRVSPAQVVFMSSHFAVFLWLLEFSPTEGLIVGSILNVFQAMVHSNARLPLGWLSKVLVTPAFHLAHHSPDEPYRDKNIGGIFTWCDRVFGTLAEELPRPGGVVRYGLGYELFRRPELLELLGLRPPRAAQEPQVAPEDPSGVGASTG